MDNKNFKEGMRRLAASVCLITTRRDDGRRAGLTATAVCSVSADPPMLLCCLNRASQTFSAVIEAGRFCVNVLSVDDAGVAHQFSGDRPSEEKFQAGRWRIGAAGSPVLESAFAAFDCRIEQAVEAGSHVILIGAVCEVALGSSAGRPLLYAQGGYGRFTAEDAQAAIDAG